MTHHNGKDIPVMLLTFRCNEQNQHITQHFLSKWTN